MCGGEGRRVGDEHPPRTTWAGDEHEDDHRRPIRWIDWAEFVLVSALLWIIVLHPPLPGIDGGCSG